MAHHRTVSEISDRLSAKLKQRSRQYVEDNLTNPTPWDYLFAENLAMIGANVVIELEAELEKETK